MIAAGTKRRARKIAHGRALWALGTVLGRSEDQGLSGAAGRLFEFSLPAVVEFSSPRAWAYALLGIQEYLNSYPGDRDAQQSTIRAQLDGCSKCIESIRRPDWKWFEDVLAYWKREAAPGHAAGGLGVLG